MSHLPSFPSTACYFKRGKAKSRFPVAAAIPGFDNLRPDDMATVEAALTGLPGGVNSSPAAAAQPYQKPTGDQGFVAEYAASSRAKCRVCEQKLEKGELRLSLPVLSENEKWSGAVPGWHHPACFFSMHKAEVNAPTDFDGYDNLRDYAKSVINSLCAGLPIPAAPEEEVDAPPTPVPKKRVKKAPVSDDEDEGVDLTIDEEAEYKPRPTKRGRKAATAREPEPEVIVVEDDEAPPPRKSKSKAKTSKGKGKARADDDDDVKMEVKPEVKTDVSVATAATPINESPYAAQARVLHRIRDEINAAVGPKMRGKWNTRIAIFQQLLAANNINIAKSDDDLLFAALSDAMTFGVAQMCTDCNSSRLVYTSPPGHYFCPVFHDWGPCIGKSDTPVLSPFVTVQDIEVDYFRNFIFNPIPRLMPQVTQQRPVSKMMTSVELRAKVQELELDSDKPLAGKVLAFCGTLGATHAALGEIVEENGGTVSKKIDASVTLLITNAADVEKSSTKVVQAQEAGIDVVDVQWIHDCAEQKKRLKYNVPKYLLKHNRKDEEAGPSAGSKRPRNLEEERGEKKVKLRVKDGIPIELESNVADTHHVLREQGLIYSVSLTKVDISQNQNSYYKIQALIPDSSRGECVLFTAWGRQNTTQGSNKVAQHPNKQALIESFNEIYTDKTGNEFGEVFRKVPGKYNLVETHVDEDFGKSNVVAGSKSTLPTPVKDLMKMIFDVQMIKNTLAELEIDAKKMPLGKLSKSQIKKAYIVLDRLSKVVPGGTVVDPATDVEPSGSLTRGGSSKLQMVNLSNEFYSLIPHDFGRNQVVVIDSIEAVRQKITLLDTLSEMEIVQQIIQAGEGDTDEDPIDIHYRSLKTELEPIERGSDIFNMISECTTSTHAPTHQEYSLEVLDIFKVKREGEDTRFAKATKRIPGSANYCFAHAQQPEGVLLLSEVLLGEPYERIKAEYVEKLPAGTHSTKGIGGSAPSQWIPHPGDPNLLIPMGPVATQKMPESFGRQKGELLYDEHIVYETDQAKIRYAVKVKFNFKKGAGRR
ncbi:hypothetical protein SmJEL517_g04376 [Synchytrium microbalum]|uniref:Poly [ADP-ribose] polymerase n=1 Tax=Synchytrium microbalum TaxID=1806994 RepID=A0A507C3N2_9FUNG|nr:uncharacterized protein SmJEL517_g04376 [Synchytrium microbalum]TPX32566.1 hypothetical protein SmJEL517_g04376 [Synchytrium microbalum]